MLNSRTPSSRQLDWHSLFALATLFFLISSVFASSPAHDARRHTTFKRTVNSRRTCKSKTTNSTAPQIPSKPCFPSVGYIPSGQPNVTADQWWCDRETESGFFGFSYMLSGCPDKDEMSVDFKKMRTMYNTRYVRLYNACSNEPKSKIKGNSYLDDTIAAAYENGMGVFGLMWFGFDSPKDTSWKARFAEYNKTIKNNALAPYVLRSVDIGSEPLFDSPPEELVRLMGEMKNTTAGTGIQVGISDMKYAFTRLNAKDLRNVLNATDYIHAHELQYLGADATTGANAWESMKSDLQWFAKTGKKITITESGWPNNKETFKPNSAKVDTSIASTKGYIDMYNKHCGDMRDIAGHGGVGWFWQAWDDILLPGWGLMDSKGKPRFDFTPNVTCEY